MTKARGEGLDEPVMTRLPRKLRTVIQKIALEYGVKEAQAHRWVLMKAFGQGPLAQIPLRLGTSTNTLKTRMRKMRAKLAPR